jgi:hypothetical protein
MRKKSIIKEKDIISILKGSDFLSTSDIADRLSEEIKNCFSNKDSLNISLRNKLEKLVSKGIVEEKYFGQKMWRLKR